MLWLNQRGGTATIMRNLNRIAALFIGLMGLLAILNNLFNITVAQSFGAAVISAPEQPYYKIIGPAFSAGWQAWLGLGIIMAGELAAGVLGFIGAARMFVTRSGGSSEFQSAQSLAIAGCARGLFVGSGFFVVMGELYFNMCQTEFGLGSVRGAFRYGHFGSDGMWYISRI